MSADEISEPTPGEAVEPTETAAETTASEPGDGPILKLSWTRRAFFQAAALGAAAAAFLDGKRFVPSIAWANDLSTNPCTAGDVEIIGTGIVLNEPCTCSPGGTFNATVQFTVRNNTST